MPVMLPSAPMQGPFDVGCPLNAVPFYGGIRLFWMPHPVLQRLLQAIQYYWIIRRVKLISKERPAVGQPMKVLQRQNANTAYHPVAVTVRHSAVPNDITRQKGFGRLSDEIRISAWRLW